MSELTAFARQRTLTGTRFIEALRIRNVVLRLHVSVAE
jgi:hypothetical protein